MEVSLFIKINLNEEPWPDFPEDGSFMSCVETDKELNQTNKNYQHIYLLEEYNLDSNNKQISILLTQRSDGGITK